MSTNLKVILTAFTVAVLASPVMAQAASHPHAASSTGSISNARGSVAHTRASRVTPVVEGNQFHVNDAVHVPFPQESNGL